MKVIRARYVHTHVGRRRPELGPPLDQDTDDTDEEEIIYAPAVPERVRSPLTRPELGPPLPADPARRS